jgi:phosphoglycerol transferase MdoB-like AlkP superfamily enzyme
MLAYRIFFFYQYKPVGKPISGSMLWMGLRYDARAVSVFALSMLLLMIPGFLRPLKTKSHQLIWSLIISIIFCFYLLFHIVDYYHYDYLHQRLNASALHFLTDWNISAEMVHQTYSVKSTIASLILAGLIFFRWHILYLRDWANRPSIVTNKKKLRITYLFFGLFFALLTFGNIGQYPLRWSDAFNLGDEYKAQTSLNPFQSFFSTLKFRNTGYDEKETEKYYPLISQYYNIPRTSPFSFERLLPSSENSGNPNIILVICESFSASKSSMSLNGLNPTPYFSKLCDEGMYFERCFVPAFGTARGVWATLTGIPDVHQPSTASRNPQIVDQHILLNDFEGYEKCYFLGGSTTWANIRGLLKNNIDSLQIYEQDNFESEKVDVWGISDKNLFLEADKILTQKKKPFIAVIQTADNHRPYTIPEEDLDEFNILSLPEDTLRKHGFESAAQFNAFRYTDFTIRKFMEKVKKSSYFNNTIFAFVGDHGLRGNAGDHFPKSYTEQGIDAQHVPLLFYAPAFLPAKKINQVCSQLDIMPTLTYLAGKSILYKGMGINLIDSIRENNRLAFIADPETQTIGVVGNEFYYRERLDNKKSDFVSIVGNEKITKTPETEKVKSMMQHYTHAFYETARYLLFHNRKTSKAK